MNVTSIPLCLELEGTLTPVRIADERLMSAMKQTPSAVLRRLARLMRQRIPTISTAPAPLDVNALPLQRDLLDWLQRQRSSGRRLVLLMDGERASIEAMIGPLNLFDEILSTSQYSGTAAERRRRALVERFGEHGFDYVGNSATDTAVWAASREAIVVGDERIGEHLGSNVKVAAVFPRNHASLRTWLKAMRLHQWVKNGLIFVPALLAHVISQPHVLFKDILAFLAFGLCASSVYLLNDLFDLATDRQHPRKRLRPFAAGLLSARSGLMAAALLLAVSAAIAVTVSWKFALMLGCYYVLTWAYSLGLKRAPLLDVMVLAGLYTMRIIAGAAATFIPLSFWLLAFSVFMFLSLGFVKRFAELDDARRAGKGATQGRGYSDIDLPLIMSLGTASGYCAIVVMALYINSPDSQELYQHHKPLWLICPLMLFWISRVWIVASRGAMHDDPVVFALRDRPSLLILAALGVIVLISI